MRFGQNFVSLKYKLPNKGKKNRKLQIHTKAIQKHEKKVE